MIKTKQKINPKTKIKAYSVVQEKALFLRDMPYMPPQLSQESGNSADRPVQIRYLNDVVGLFFNTFAKVYSSEPLSDESREKMRRYLEKIFEAKDAINPTKE